MRLCDENGEFVKSRAWVTQNASRYRLTAERAIDYPTVHIGLRSISYIEVHALKGIARHLRPDAVLLNRMHRLLRKVAFEASVEKQ